MPSLPDVTQEFKANVEPYIRAIQLAITKTEALGRAALGAAAEVKALAEALNSLDNKNVVVNVAIDMDRLKRKLAEIQLAVNGLKGRNVDVGISEVTKSFTDHVSVTQDVVDVTSKHVDVTQNLSSSMTRGAADLSAQAAAARADAAAIKDLRVASADLSGTWLRDSISAASLNSVIRNQATSLADAAATTRVAIEANNQVGGTYATTAAQIGRAVQANHEFVTANHEVERTSLGLIPAIRTLFGTLLSGLNTAVIRIPFLGFGLRGVAISMGALHWILAGTMEALAVLVPAAIALGSGLMVAAQGAQQVQQHLSAVWTATEATNKAFHQTLGSVLGVGSALQKAQDAANPGIYELLGAGINILKARFMGLAQVGLTVVHMFDEFAARVTVDMQGALGGRVQGLLSNMIPDLQQLGQIAGNLGHAFLNFASDMPGLVEILLKMADAVSRFILWITGMPRGIMMAVIALEEFYRWGGLALAMLVRLVGMGGAFKVALAGIAAEGGSIGFITKFGLALKLLTGGVATAIGGLGRLVTAIGAGGLGSAVSGFGSKMSLAVEALTPLTVAGIAGVVAGIAILVVALSHVKNSTQNWIDTTNRAVQAATDLTVLGTIGNRLAQSTAMINQQQAALSKYPGAAQAAGHALGGWVGQLERIPGPVGGAVQGVFNLANKTGYWGEVTRSVLSVIPGLTPQTLRMGAGAEQAASNVGRLTKEQQHLIDISSNVWHNMQMLGTQFHTSSIGALALANAAGVDLKQGMEKGSTAARIASQQIQNYLRGIGAMGAPIGVVGNDIGVLAISSGLASSKVGQLNQAWDQFIALGSGLQSTFVTLQQGLQTLGSSALTSTVHLGTLRAEVTNLSLKTGASMNGINTASLALRSGFQASIGQANQFFDALRTGSAAGAVSSKQLTTAVASVIGEMLPYASHSKTATAQLSALAQEAGGPATSNFKTLRQWVLANGVSGKALSAMLGSMTIALSNVTAVAAQFAQVLQTDWVAAIAAGATPTKALAADTQNLRKQISLWGAGSPQAVKAAKQLDIAVIQQGGHFKDVAQLNKELGLSAVYTHSQFKLEQAAAEILSGKFGDLNSIISAGRGARGALLTDISTMISKTPTASGYIDTLARAVANHGVQAATHSSARKQLIADLEASGMKASTATGLVNGLIKMLGNIPHKELLDIIAHATGTGQVSITSTSKFIGAHGVGGPGVPVSGAAGGMVSGGGTATSDSIPARLSHGEYVVKAASVAKYGAHMMDAINQQRFAIGGLVDKFAAGGAVPVTGTPGAFTGQWESNWASQWRTQFTNTMISDVRRQMMNAIAQAKAQERAAEAAVAFSGGAGAGQWAGVVHAVLGQLGLPFGDAGTILSQIGSESGGNPNIVNKWDSNWLAGHPSVGLMQVIAGTFASWAGPYRNRGPFAYGVSMDPMANVYAGVNYAIHQYGNPGFLSVLGQGHGYGGGGLVRNFDQGGTLMPGINILNNTTGGSEHLFPAGINPGGPMIAEVHCNVYLDGKQIWHCIQQETLKYNSRNSGARTGIMKPSSPISTAINPGGPMR